jgi:hypothetical protein
MVAERGTEVNEVSISVAYPLLRVGKEKENQAEELRCGRVGEHLSSQLNQKEQSAP